MKKRVAIVLAVTLLPAGVVLHRLCDGWTIIEAAAKLHSEWGSTNCGHVTNSSYHGERIRAETAIACVQIPSNAVTPLGLPSLDMASTTNFPLPWWPTQKETQLKFYTNLEWEG